MSTDVDKTVEACLRAIVNDVAAQTGQPVEDVQRLFDLASFVHEHEKAKALGILAPAPKGMQ